MHESDAARRPAVVPPEASPPRGTVLVVDDEVLIIDFLATSLERLGVRVVTARTGEDALVVAERNPPPTLALVDVNLPGVSGEETCKALLARYPRIQLTLMSGLHPGHFSSPLLNAERASFLQKPFSLRTLTEHVTAVFGAHTSLGGE